jgi:hypothetical protein
MSRGFTSSGIRNARDLAAARRPLILARAFRAVLPAPLVIITFTEHFL